MHKYAVGIILGFLVCGLICQAQAQPLLEKDPFIFEYDLVGPAAIESESIKASGIIKTISIFYESSGQVRLEVSADGGNAYVKIINGKPLTEGFIPGNQLRFRANLAPDSSLKKIIIGYTDSSGLSRLYRNPDLAKYKNHKVINISGSNQELFNYPLSLNLERNDVYFTAGDGQTPLYYYLEDPLHGYVKVPQIPKEGLKIYMYYGQESAKPFVPKYLDGNKVFLFFDDFNAAALDTEKWEVTSGLKKEFSLKNGYLQLKDGAIISRNFKIKQGVLEFKAKAEENAGIQALVHKRISGQTSAGFPYEQIVYSSAYPGAEHTIAINDIAKLNVGKPIKPFTFYKYRVILNPASIIFERYSQNYEKQAQIQFLDVGNPEENQIGLKANAALFNAGSVYFDWIRVRPYVEIEPKVLK